MIIQKAHATWFHFDNGVKVRVIFANKHAIITDIEGCVDLRVDFGKQIVADMLVDVLNNLADWKPSGLRVIVNGTPTYLKQRMSHSELLKLLPDANRVKFRHNLKQERQLLPKHSILNICEGMVIDVYYRGNECDYR